MPAAHIPNGINSKMFGNNLIKWLILRSIHTIKNICFRCDVGDKSIVRLVENCYGLESIDMNRCVNLTDISILKLAECCSNLHTLKVSDCVNLTDISILKLAECCSKLKYLNISFCNNLTDSLIIKLLECCKEIQYINISWCDRMTYSFLNNLPTYLYFEKNNKWITIKKLSL
jgi:hypothetical protein